jgi:hypothetical protein
MLGAKQIELNMAELLAKGMSSSAESTDGGFSPETDAINPIAVPGILYAPALPTDKSTNLTGEIIASCEDPTGTYSRILVSQDADQDGRVFSLSTSNALATIGSEDTASDYVQGKTDMVAYKSEVYFSSAGQARRLSDIAGTPTLDAGGSWPFSYGSATAPHPLLVFEDSIYHGDGNLLLRQSTVGDSVVPATVLTLPAGSVITALGIDPGSGKMLISYVGQFNVSGTVNTQARVGFYDGFSNKLSRTVIVEEMITAFPAVEGVQYAAYGQNLGYWNGSGVSFLRRFGGLAYDNTELLYKHHFASIGSTLYFLVDTQIIAHGHVYQGGSKVFYPAFKNQVNSNNLTHICNIGSGLLGMSFSSAKFYTWSTTSVATTNTMAFVFNIIRTPRPIALRGVFAEWADLVTNGTTPINLTCQNRSVIGSAESYASMGSFVNTSGSSIKETWSDIIGMANPKGRTFKMRVTTDTNNFGIARFVIPFDVIE